MQDKQATYELQREREAQPIDSDSDESITLTCGDGEAEVFYAEDGFVTSACIGGVNLERESFSAWQLAAWEASIDRHLRALEQEAWEAQRDRG